MTGLIAREHAPGRITINLSALADNWRKLARLAAPGRCAAVVKANAYGVGLAEAAPALWEAGARIFFVAHLSEGVAARGLLPEASIYVLNGLESGRTRRTMRKIAWRRSSGRQRSWSAGPPSPRYGAGRRLALYISTPA